MTKLAAAVALGRAGGLVKSNAKTAAVRLNGRKGGRPRKPLSELKYPRRKKKKDGRRKPLVVVAVDHATKTVTFEPAPKAKRKDDVTQLTESDL